MIRLGIIIALLLALSSAHGRIAEMECLLGRNVYSNTVWNAAAKTCVSGRLE